MRRPRQPLPGQLYNCWRGLLGRCENPNHPSYHHYGGRGIQVCERWQSFANFVADMSPRPSAAHTLDRRDNDGDYEPENCRWATQTEQNQNTRIVRRVTAHGVTRTLREWSDATGLNIHTLRKRLYKGWPDELIVTTPTQGACLRVRQRNILPALAESGLARSSLYKRLAKGWTLEEAVHRPKHPGRHSV